ncbi:MAG: hypothetical protein V4447_05675 [Pseudomonadota bacterium]
MTFNINLNFASFVDRMKINLSEHFIDLLVLSVFVTADFQRQNPRPSTGRTTGACKGYVKDHIKALDRGGADAVHNLQWQTVADAKAKDKCGRKECRR